MLRHLVAPQGSSLCTLPSVSLGLAASAVVFFIASGAAYWPKPADKQGDEERLVAYVAPTLPTGKSLDTAGVTWAPSNADGSGDRSKASKGTGLDVAGDNRTGIGLGRRGNDDVPSVDLPDIDAIPSGKVYVDAEVDREVQRDPTSAAPEYPSYLQENHIEGSLTVEFVVDTTGGADSTSLRVIHSSHPAFEQSLRAAIPHMRFVPAELGGRLVRQWVRQEFRFLMPDQPTTTM
jgi:TonB family protein